MRKSLWNFKQNHGTLKKCLLRLAATLIYERVRKSLWNFKQNHGKLKKCFLHLAATLIYERNMPREFQIHPQLFFIKSTNASQKKPSFVVVQLGVCRLKPILWTMINWQDTIHLTSSGFQNFLLGKRNGRLVNVRWKVRKSRGLSSILGIPNPSPET